MNTFVIGILAGVLALSPVQEDDPGWDCTTMGDRSCGPTNSQGVTAGCYSDTGAMVAPWPCRIVVSADGTSDVYGGR